MNADAIRIAAQRTLQIATRLRPDVKPSRWEGCAGERGKSPENNVSRVADALWQLGKIPELIDSSRVDLAMYALSAAHTLLWIADVASMHDLEAVYETAKETTHSMA